MRQGMRRAGLAVAIVLAFAGRVDAAGPQSVADIAEKLSPAVVNISTTQTVSGSEAVPVPDLPEGSPFKDFFDEYFKNQQRKGGDVPEPRKVNSLGSGFIIDPQGLIVTNNHVIDEADEIDVTLADGTNLTAKLVGKDIKTDLALLKVTSDKPLPAVPFGDSDKIRVGDWVMAIGNPFGLGGSVTVGIVSARNRDINAGDYDQFIQTDAAINRGNSGGPLFDMDGEVVGINTAIISPSGGSIGIGFAVPSNTARKVVDQLRQYGETRRGWLGVKIQVITPEMAQSLKIPAASGALVADVTHTGPAEAAGIKTGDVITAFAGKPIKEMRDLPRLVAETPVGEMAPVDLLRDGQPLRLEVRIGRLEEGEKLSLAQDQQPQDQAQEAPSDTPDDGSATAAATLELGGMTLSLLSDQLRKKFKIANGVHGVLVTAVKPNTAAADKRIEQGDVIIEAGEQTVNAPEQVAERAAELQKQGKTTMLLLVSKTARQGETRFIALRLKR